MNAFIDLFSQFSAVFMGIFIEAVPFLLLGTLASGVVEVLLSRDELVRLLPKNALLGALAGSLLGLAFPVCECGVVPLTRRLFQKGAPAAVGMAFLMAAPVLNPVVIASTYAAFGNGPLLWGRLGLTLLVAVCVGLVFSRQGDPNELLRMPILADPSKVAGEGPPEPVLASPALSIFAQGSETRSQRAGNRRFTHFFSGKTVEIKTENKNTSRLTRIALVAVDEFFEMGRYLVAGALLAAALQTFIPQAWLASIGRGPVLSVVAMLLIAVLLSVCSTVDAFIALAFSGQFATGSILAFLVYGPMVDIKSTLMFAGVFKRRSVAYLVLLPLLLTMLATIAWNLVGG